MKEAITQHKPILLFLYFLFISFGILWLGFGAIAIIAYDRLSDAVIGIIAIIIACVISHAIDWAD